MESRFHVIILCIQTELADGLIDEDQGFHTLSNNVENSQKIKTLTNSRTYLKKLRLLHTAEIVLKNNGRSEHFNVTQFKIV